MGSLAALATSLAAPIPAALPMKENAPTSYGYAPSWDYQSDSYVDYDDQPGYAGGAYSEDYDSNALLSHGGRQCSKPRGSRPRRIAAKSSSAD